MPRSSKQKTFKNESEEAAWFASPEGRRTTQREMDEGVRNGTAKFYAGGEVQKTDPVVLRELMDRVKAKQTQAISLRLPKGDIEAAKKIGEAAGIGYQSVLKAIINKGLRQA